MSKLTENATEIRVFEIPWQGPEAKYLKKVSDCDRLVPGLSYLVPCVQGGIADPEFFWPIIPLPHRDGHNQRNLEIGNHAHYDVRFLSWPQVQALIRLVGEEEAPTEIDIRHWGRTMRIVHLIRTDSLVIEWRPRRCVLKEFFIRAEFVAWDELREIFAHSRMCDRKCPHQGYDLSNVKPNKRGVIECPLHGLIFDPDTGKVIPVQGPKKGTQWS